MSLTWQQAQSDSHINIVMHLLLAQITPNLDPSHALCWTTKVAEKVLMLNYNVLMQYTSNAYKHKINSFKEDISPDTNQQIMYKSMYMQQEFI